MDAKIMSSNFWIITGLLAIGYSAYAIPHGFSLRSNSSQSSTTQNGLLNLNDSHIEGDVNIQLHTTPEEIEKIIQQTTNKTQEEKDYSKKENTKDPRENEKKIEGLLKVAPKSERKSSKDPTRNVEILTSGTAFMVIQFPQPWPLKTIKTLFSTNQGKTLIRLDGYSDGHLRAIIKNEKINYSFESQPLRIEGIGDVILLLTWKDSEIKIYINGGNPLKPFDPSNLDYRAIKLKSLFSTEDPISIAHPQAKEICKKWIDWRRGKFINPPKVAEENKRLKTEIEETQELVNAIKSLKILLILFQEGNKSLLGQISSQLKSLIYWDENENTNSLLFRLASRKEIPLPVYAFNLDPSEGPPILSEAVIIQEPTIPTFKKNFPKQELMDFQSWLDSPIQIEEVDKGKSDLKNGRLLSPKEIIHEATVVHGVGYRNEDVSQSFDQFRQTKIMGDDLLAQFLISISQVTIVFGEFIIQNLKK